MHGAMFVPVIAGSDKTTVSIVTGHQEYHPVYMSPGNLTNTAWHAHGNTLLPVMFLPNPKSVGIRDCAGCNVPPHDLDHEGSCKRSEPKTEFLIGAWEPGTLWTDFGVCTDVVVIKGTFKDHIVTWINEYLMEEHGES
ncbi:hypothetical protein BGW80DRAFT_1255931 [Lactifluus volemus]|nr:hypothetical protein BGW80DRAFT_1255931 [Lactifluus volemus]